MNTLKQILLILFVLLLGHACKEQDMMFREYTVDGGITYPAKAKDVEVYAGKERVQICWMNIDPTVTYAKIFWNNYQDSLLVDIPKGTDEVVQTVNVPEGEYSFIIITYDDKENMSIPVEIFGSSYGAMYEQSLVNRFLQSVEYTDDDELLLDWEDAREGEIGVQLEYVDVEGRSQTLLIPATETQTVIPDVLVSEPLYYTTMYKPDATAMDIFYAQTQSIKVKIWKDITSQVLENAKQPFSRGENSFPFDYHEVADWKTNASGGGNGNVVGATGELVLWVYYSATIPIKEMLNGKLYQTVELEAGLYWFYASVIRFYTENTSANYKVFVAAGLDDDLPDIDDVEGQALGFASIPYGVTGSFSFQFELSEKRTVSLGFVANLAHS